MSDYLTTGSLGLDCILGGGWKRGTICEIWGEPGSGKTTLAEHAVWELGRDEFAFWMSLGTEVPHRKSSIVYGAPRNAELAFQLLIEGALQGVPLAIVDSANGLVRQRELDNDPDYIPHPQREYKDELTELRAACATSGTIVIFLSKPRNTDRQPVRGTGISEKSAARVKLEVLHRSQENVLDITAHANKAQAGFILRPGTGIDWSLELAHMAIRQELIAQRGGWYECNHERFQGVKQLAKFIEDNTRLAVDLDREIRAKAGIL